jgi:hypothetical protein
LVALEKINVAGKNGNSMSWHKFESSFGPGHSAYYWYKFHKFGMVVVKVFKFIFQITNVKMCLWAHCNV